MSGRLDVWLWLLHRASGALLAPLIIAHLVTIVVAVQGGLDAAEILARTRGSVFWGGYYFLFVATAGLHAAIGMRSFLAEHARLAPPLATAVGGVIGCVLLAMGWRAVAGLVLR